MGHTVKRRKNPQPVDISAWMVGWAKRTGAVEVASYDSKPEYRLDTIVGPLTAKAISGITGGVWLACRFEDVEAARKHFGVKYICTDRLNPYSGKWNFCEALGRDDAATVAYMLNQFDHETSRLIKAADARATGETNGSEPTSEEVVVAGA